MRVLVVGAGRAGVHVLRQLQKNPDLKVITLDPIEEPFAVQQGIISQVDIHETLTPLTLDYVIAQARPDLILLTAATEDLGLGTTTGIDMLAGALREEIAAIADVPVIEVSRAAVR